MHCRVLVITENNSFFEVVERIKSLDCNDEKLKFDDYQIGGRFFHGQYTVKVAEIDKLGKPYTIIAPYEVITTEYYDSTSFNIMFEYIKHKYLNYYVTVVDMHM